MGMHLGALRSRCGVNAGHRSKQPALAPQWRKPGGHYRRPATFTVAAGFEKPDM
jgi:hypothetical protein